MLLIWFLSKLEPRFLFLKMSVVIFINIYFFKVKRNIDFCFVFKLSSSSQNWHYWFWFWTITGPGLAALWHANTQPETDQSWLNPGNQKLKCQTNAGTGPMLAFLYWTITLGKKWSWPGWVVGNKSWRASSQPDTDQSWLNHGSQKLARQTDAGTGPMLAFLYRTIT